MKIDIRWEQRFSNFISAFEQLQQAVELASTRPLSKLEKQGLIQAFEFTHELAWNVLKDYFSDQGNNSITGSKDAAREAFNRGLILDGTVWMEMIKSRNLTSHTYNEKVAEDIVMKITNNYFKAFEEFKQIMKERVSPK
ncbi:MAG: nucleotidyltransferase substrate binding protein [Bdellovibrio sp.]